MFRKLAVVVCLIVPFFLTGCNKKGGPRSATDSTGQPTLGVEKVKPAPGTGNVQGKVFYNDGPVENIEVKLCETFDRFLSGCGGKIYTARSDKDGEFVITNVEPKEYQGLTVRVFDTDSYVFATMGMGVNATKYTVNADKTSFVSPTHIFKGDLKMVNPKAGSTVKAQDLELKWDAYPDATHYRFTLNPENSQITPPYVKRRVDGASFKLDKPVEKGTYRWYIEAYNKMDRKLSESSGDYKFTIN